MHLDRCPKCGKPGYLVLKLRKCGKPNCRCAAGGAMRHGPYPAVQHHTTHAGAPVVHHIGLKVLGIDEGARIRLLLEKYREKREGGPHG